MSVSRVQLDVLRVLRDRGRIHVYGIKKELGSRSVYAAVSALQLAGMVEVEWEQDVEGQRPPRKFVELAALGQRALIEADASSSSTVEPALT